MWLVCQAFTRYQKKERWGTNNDKTNDKWETIDAQSRTTPEEPPLNTQLQNYNDIFDHLEILPPFSKGKQLLRTGMCYPGI